MAFFRKLTKHKNTQKLEHDACLPIKFLFNDRFCDQLLCCVSFFMIRYMLSVGSGSEMFGTLKVTVLCQNF